MQRLLRIRWAVAKATSSEMEEHTVKNVNGGNNCGTFARHLLARAFSREKHLD